MDERPSGARYPSPRPLQATLPRVRLAFHPAIAAPTSLALSPVQPGRRPATRSWRLRAYLDFRKQPASPCQDRCLARNACPVGADHRYAGWVHTCLSPTAAARCCVSELTVDLPKKVVKVDRTDLASTAGLLEAEEMIPSKRTRSPFLNEYALVLSDSGSITITSPGCWPSSEATIMSMGNSLLAPWSETCATKASQATPFPPTA